MSTRIDEAIITKWTAHSLGETFTGGIHNSAVAPPDTASPYVRLLSLGTARTGQDTSFIYRRTRRQFSIFMRADGSSDPISAAGALARLLINTFDDKTAADHLQIPAVEGFVRAMTYQSEDYREEEEDWIHYWVTFAIEWQQSRS